MPISQEIIATIAAIDPAFTSLELAEKSLSDDDILHLMRLLQNKRFITSLDLRGNLFGSVGIEALSQNHAITNLDISRNQLTAADIATISQSPAIKILGIAECQIGRAGAEILLRSDTLEDLNISSNDIDYIDPQIIEANHSIKYLDLSNNNLSHANKRAFMEALAQNDTIKHLDLICTNINNADLTILLQSRSIIDLNIEHNLGITQDRDATILAAITQNNILIALDGARQIHSPAVMAKIAENLSQATIIAQQLIIALTRAAQNPDDAAMLSNILTGMSPSPRVSAVLGILENKINRSDTIPELYKVLRVTCNHHIEKAIRGSEFSTLAQELINKISEYFPINSIQKSAESLAALTQGTNAIKQDKVVNDIIENFKQNKVLSGTIEEGEKSGLSTWNRYSADTLAQVVVNYLSPDLTIDPQNPKHKPIGETLDRLHFLTAVDFNDAKKDKQRFGIQSHVEYEAIKQGIIRYFAEKGDVDIVEFFSDEKNIKRPTISPANSQQTTTAQGPSAVVELTSSTRQQLQQKEYSTSKSS